VTQLPQDAVTTVPACMGVKAVTRTTGNPPAQRRMATSVKARLNCVT